jgi:O-antigen ligase
VKWIALLAAVGAVIPFAGWLRRHPGETLKVWMLVGFLPFGIGAIHLYMAAISWPGWPGYAVGTEISILDLLAISLLLSLEPTGRPLPFRWPMLFYFVAVLMSIFQTEVPMASVFYAWQIARVFLVYAAVAKGCGRDQRVVAAVLTGMAIGLTFEAGHAMYQHFHLGVPQPGGSFGHQNFLGLVTHFVVFPWLALLLAGQRGLLPFVGPLAGLLIAVLTVSRATIGLAAGGYVIMFMLSALRRWTPRKALFAVAGVATVGILIPVVLSSFAARFARDPISDGYDERAAFTRAAKMMIADNPFGIGPNNYVVIANTQEYNSRAGVASIVGSDSANVHNVYLLVAAESGIAGLITFVLVLLQPLVVAFRCGWRARGDIRGDLLLGLGLSLLIVYIHSYFEWIFITFAPQYMFALDAGMVAGLAMQLGYWRSSAVRPASVPVAAALADTALADTTVRR